MFIQHLAQLAHSVAKSERKPRRNIQYRDLATAISNHDNLEFLTDVVPHTLTFKQIKEKKASSKSRKPNGAAISETEAGQTLLDISSYHGSTQLKDAADEQDGNLNFNE
ncbi:putative cbf nf-y family transcription factor [Erysiphe necator]|uniref:Putative cbf nf-y family transcription factor n=1 Tax=Uncinula necator TaxID=52586 RepID=A0A0B1P758_UNCNE|nr:putative cbf nf-y family transcription factor [Erysiphe necator]